MQVIKLNVYKCHDIQYMYTIIIIYVCPPTDMPFRPRLSAATAAPLLHRNLGLYYLSRPTPPPGGTDKPYKICERQLLYKYIQIHLRYIQIYVLYVSSFFINGIQAVPE